MKRMINANDDINILTDALKDDLSSSFEGDIINRYSDFVEEDNWQTDPAEARRLYSTLNKARSAYVNALADVIRKVDVNDLGL